MSHQRRFEGPDVRVLLDEICATYGTEPTISKAETFRTGGVMGFFQRECYRLIVEEPEGAGNAAQSGAVHGGAAQAGAAHTPVAASVEITPAAVVAAYSEAATAPTAAFNELTAAEFLDGATRSTSESPVCWGTEAVDPFASLADSSMDDTVLISTGLTAALPSIQPLPPLAAEDWEPPVMDELPSFDEILRRVAQAVDAPIITDAAPVVWPRVDKSGEYIPAHFQAAPATDSSDDAETASLVKALEATLTGGPTGAPTGAPTTEPAVEREAGDDIVAIPDGRTASVYRRPQAEEDAPSGRGAGGRVSAIREALALAGEAAGPGHSLDALIGVGPVPARATLADRIAGSVEVEVEAAGLGGGETIASPAVDRRVDESLVAQLSELGLRRSIANSIERTASQGWSIEASILNAMADLPSAPPVPHAAGSVVVVVGPGPRADAEAMRIAAELGSDQAYVGFVRTARGAADFAADRREDQVAVVSVEAPAGSRAPVLAWASRLMDDLQPGLVVAVVDAMHKNDDLATWITALGGVDTLVVDHIESTSSPAGILELEVPVSRLGDHAATPARWAATIADHFGEAGEAVGPDAVDAGIARIDAEVR